MKHKFAAFAMLLAAVLTLGSCLKEDSNNYVYTDDSAITSFYVTSAKQYHYTKTKAGRDSVYTTLSSYTSYHFCIDQATNTIYNPDSLPCGVDARRLVCSFAGLSSSGVYMKSLTSDSLTYITTSDSLDFSQPRELQVLSNSGQALRKYTVTVNIHKEQADSFAWHEMPATADLQNIIAAKAVATYDGGSRLLLFATDGTATNVYTMTAGEAWRKATLNFNHTLSADAYKGVVAKDGYAYIADGGNIMRTINGDTWSQTGTATGVARLVAASPLCLYGYGVDGQLLASSDNGATWTSSSLDSDASLLPSAETATACNALRTNADSYRVTLFGNSADGAMAVWGKIDEGGEYSESQPWAYYNVSEDNRHALPQLTGISAMAYDEQLYVLGTPAGHDASDALLYCSQDGGITWNADSVLGTPAHFAEALPLSAASALTLTVDGDNFVWAVNAKSGRTWRGRINRLGWAKPQTDFSK